MNPRIYLAVLVLCLAGCPQREQPDALHTPKTGATAMAAVSSVASAASQIQTSPMAANAGAYVPGDINGDGRSDLLLDNRGSGRFAYWLMNGIQIDQYSPTTFFTDLHAQQRLTGDFNGDGRMDQVMVRASDRSVVLLLNQDGRFVAQPIGNYTAGWRIAAAGDVDGDGKTDLVLVNDEFRYLAYWIMDGAMPVRYSVPYAWPEGARALGATGDFDRNGKLDVLWIYPANPLSNSDARLWSGDGNGFQVSVVPASALPLNWQFTGAGDINGDGKDDLLLTNDFDGFFAYWVMDSASIVRKSIGFARPFGARLVAFGDYHGDGKLDLVWWRGFDRVLLQWRGDGFGFTQAPIRETFAGWDVHGVSNASYVRGDVDGDGRSDLLLFNEAFRTFSFWLMSGANAAPTRALALQQPAGYRLASTGDLNGDRRVDLVWVRDSDRHVLVSYFVGVGINHYSSMTLGEGWAVVRTGDMDGDDRDDLLLHNDASDLFAYASMDGWKPVSFSPAYYTYGRSLVAVGDFDANRRLDLVWADESSRALQLWSFDGVRFEVNSIQGGGAILRYAAGWRVTGAGDVNGDGYSDLLLANAEGVAYWTMRASVVQTFSPGFLNPAGYGNVATGDYNADGKLDLIWGRDADGSVLLWQGDGTGFLQSPVTVSYRSGFRIIEP